MSEPLSEEIKKRMDTKVDQWTLAWWNEKFSEVLKGYRGASHAANCAIAEFSDAHKAIEELRQRCKSLEEGRYEDRAKIGELQARVERMAEFLNTLKQGTK